MELIIFFLIIHLHHFVKRKKPHRQIHESHLEEEARYHSSYTLHHCCLRLYRSVTLLTTNKFYLTSWINNYPYQLYYYKYSSFYPVNYQTISSFYRSNQTVRSFCGALFVLFTDREICWMLILLHSHSKHLIQYFMSLKINKYKLFFCNS